MIEVTRTERAVKQTDLEAALHSLDNVVSLCESRGGDDNLVFPPTYDKDNKINPLYDVSGKVSIADLHALIKCNGWDVLRALPY